MDIVFEPMRGGDVAAGEQKQMWRGALAVAAVVLCAPLIGAALNRDVAQLLASAWVTVMGAVLGMIGALFGAF